MPKHIYIHFPFCLKKCSYCDFNSVGLGEGEIPSDQYTKALIQEFKTKHTADSNEKVQTIYFGGGTPSLFKPDNIAAILKAIDDACGVVADAEVTLECNPGTVDEKKISEFIQAGINRFSVGVQSFDDAVLQKIGRIHSVNQAYETIDWIQKQNVRASLDLMYGYPEQSLNEWKKDLEKALDLGVTHLSCYALTIEDNTPLGKQVKKGYIKSLHSDDVANMQELTYQMSGDKGLPAYEISNFAKPGFECRHNIEAYWKYGSYLGLGVGAVGQIIGLNHSTSSGHEAQGAGLKVSRKHCFSLVEEYLEGGFKYHVESVLGDDVVKEYIMMGLRMCEGLWVKEFNSLFSKDFLNEYHSQVQEAFQKGLAVLENGGFKPTTKGIMLNHALIGLFF